MHVLFVAGVFDDDGVISDGVGVVPFSCVCHVPTFVLPALENWRATEERRFYESHISNGSLCISDDVHCVEGMLVFQGNIPIKTPYTARRGWTYFILVLHLWSYILIGYLPQLKILIRLRTGFDRGELANRRHSHRVLSLNNL